MQIAPVPAHREIFHTEKILWYEIGWSLFPVIAWYFQVT
jgi:hypothetical protein